MHTGKKSHTFFKVRPAKNEKGKGKARADSEAGDATSSDEGENTSGEDAGPDAPLGDEDEFDEIADRFESSYNFRFEEPYVSHFFR